MNGFFYFYLVGVIVSVFICAILTAAKKEIRVFDIISFFLNVICSWATLISLIGMAINGVLQRTGNNKVLWHNKK